MTDRIAIVLGIVLVLAILADVFWLGGDTLLFLSRKMLELIEWMAFWR